MKNHETKEKEDVPMQKDASIKDILILFLKRFGTIFAVALAFAIAMAGLGGARSYRCITDSATVEKQQEDYLLKLEEFNANLFQLRGDVEKAKKRQEELREYTAKSIYYNLDCFNEAVSEVVFYVDTGFQIMPNLNYQNPNKTGDVVSAYCEAYRSAALYQGISDIVGEDINEKYLDEIIEIERAGDTKIKDSLGNVTVRHAEGNNGVVIIRCRYSDEETATKITDFVFEFLKKNISDTILPHTASVLARSSMVVIDETLNLVQQSTAKELEDIQTKILTKGAELSQKERTSPQPPVNSTTMVVKKTLIYGVAGGILGGVLSCIWIVLSYLTDNRISGAGDVARLYNLELLGILREDEKKKRKRYLFSRLIARLECDDGVEIKNREASMLAEANIKGIAESFRTSFARTQQITLLVTGTAPTPTVRKAVDLLEQSGNIEIKYQFGESVLQSGRALELLHMVEGVVLVEQVGTSMIANINKEILRIEKQKCPIVGILLMD